MPALLLLRCKRPFPNIAQLDFAFHASRALQRSFVTDFPVNIGDLEAEFHLIALYRSRC